jgi:hypothetical protein
LLHPHYLIHLAQSRKHRIMSNEPIIIEREVIGDENLSLVKSRVEALNKKAAKKKMPGIEFKSEATDELYVVVGKAELQRVMPTNSLDLISVVPVYTCRIETVGVKYDGWRLLGVLSPLNGANLVNEVPGQVIPEGFRDRVNECDHCGQHRARTETFVVGHDDGRVGCVGRNCLKDFLGHNVQGILIVHDLMEATSSDEFWGGGSSSYQDLYLETYLAWVASVIAVDGWASVSGTRYDGTPTCTIACMCMMNDKPFTMDAEKWRDYVNERSPKPEHVTLAQEALVWARSLENSENNYQANLALLVKGCRIGRKHVGLAASIVSSFQNIKMAKKVRQEIKDEWVGTKGERMLLDVTVVKVIPCSGQFGTVGLHIMRTQEGHSLTWFSSSADWLETGSRYLVKATIKKHEWYQDRRNADAPQHRQTSLSRVTVQETKDEEEGRVYSSEAV